MSGVAVAGGRTAWRGRLGTEAQPAGRRLDARRTLQLGLAAIWLLDALLQYQSFMYSKGFTQMIGGTATGNPSVIARPITWNATLVSHHQVLVNTVFATVQLLLGLGIAFRPTVRVALAASIAWALGVWWFGEGLGGVLSGAASPLNGAPGAVIIYALLAVLLWPADRETAAPFTAARAVGAPVARALWLVLWLSLAYFALTPANRAPQALNGMIATMESGQPGWLSAIDRGAATLVAHQGLAASIVLAVALVLIAVGVYLPPSAAKATLVLAIVVALVIWVVGEAFGDDSHRRWNRPQLRTAAGAARADFLAGYHADRDSPGRTHRREGGLMTPAWILDIFAALMLMVAAVSAARLVEARPWQRGSGLLDTDMAHLLMGIAMAGMLASRLTTLSNAAWVVIFAVLTAWFAFRVVMDARANGAQALAGGHCAPHLVHSAAMVYMFAAIATPAASGGSGMSDGRGVGDADPAVPHPGVRLRADPDRLQHLGHRPAVRQALQHGTGARVAGQCRGGRPGDGGRRGPRRRLARGPPRSPRPRPAACRPAPRPPRRPGLRSADREAARAPPGSCSLPLPRSAAGSRWESPWP